MENLIEENLRVLLKKRYVLVLFVILFLVLDSLVFVLPYYLKGYVIPVGWDTAWYVRNMQLIKEQGLYPFFMKTHGINLFCILEYLFASAFNISFMLTATIVPIVVSLLFPLVNFQIVRRFTGSWKLSLVGMAFTIIDYNIVRMTVDLHRNLFCLLLSQIAVFLILPRLLEKTSKKDVFIFVSLMTMAGLSQVETFAVVMVILFLLSISYIRKHFLHASKLLWLCILGPALFVISVEAPFLPIFAEGHIVLNPAVNPYRQDFVAQPWSYLVFLGAGLFPLYIVGMYCLLKNLGKDMVRHECLLICFWNFVVIIGSFLPWFGVRVPGWRVLLLTTVPPVATLGFAKLFSKRSSVAKKKIIVLTVLTVLTVLITLSLATIIASQRRSYKPWISEDNFEKLVWISDENQNNPCIFVLCLNKSLEWAELYRNWVWAVVGTRTNVYFGDVDSLLQSEPTNFKATYLNTTSNIFWGQLEDFTLAGADIYLIKEWYELSLGDEKLEEVAPGIYHVKH